MKRLSTIPLAGLICAEFLSLLGNQIAAIAIPLFVLQQYHSTLATGIAIIGSNLSFIIAAFIGGKAIDSFGAWKMSFLADILSFISVVALPIVLLIYSNDISLFYLLTLILLGSLFDSTGIAARNTLVPSLSRFAGRNLAGVNAVRGGLENASDFAGPAISIALFTLVSINIALFANALSFLLSALLFAFMVPKKRTRVKKTFNTDIFLGLRLVFGNTQLRILAVTGMISGFTISSFLGLLLLVLASQHFHSPVLYGISLSSFSFIAVISSLLFSKLIRLFSYSFIYYVGLLTIGTGIILCGINTTQYGVILSAGLAGAAGVCNPLEQTILQEETSERNAGQVFAALPAIRFAAGSLGLLVTGLLAEVYEVNRIFLLEGGLLIITAACGWIVAPFRKSSRIDRNEILKAVR